MIKLNVDIEDLVLIERVLPTSLQSVKLKKDDGKTIYYEHLLEVTVNSVSYIFDLDDDSFP